MMSNHEINEQISVIMQNYGGYPLFYIESGSRLWGIASPDSDYDVRGFHLQTKEQYFDFRNHRDLIEVMDGDFDFVSYGLDKMFGLLAKSNPKVFEWVRANIVYLNHLPDWQSFIDQLISNIDFKALFHHYKSMAKGNLNEIELHGKFTYKKIFYCVRGLMSAQLAARHTIPELLIDNLFQQFDTENAVIQIAKESLEQKKQKNEKELIPEKNKQFILTALYDFVHQLETVTPSQSNNPEKLNRLLTDYSFALKQRYYCNQT